MWNKEYISYDVESPFTNVPIQETIHHIYYMGYVLIAWNLLKANIWIGSDLYVTHAEKGVLDTCKPKFCKYFVDDIIIRRNKDWKDYLKKLNNNRPKINYIAEVEQKKS